MNKLKGLLAHSNPKITTGELVEKLCDLGIQQWNPGQKMVRTRKTKTPPLNRHRVSKVTVRKIWQHAKSQCQTCGSHHALEVDHIQPKAQGGNSGLDNLRLLCRNCNQRAAIEKLGLGKMSLYLSPPK